MVEKEVVKDVLRKADCVTLDVDSTLCMDETIDEMAAFLGKRDEIAAKTKLSMDGQASFQETLRESLQILNLSFPQLHAFVGRKETKYSPNVKNFISLLQNKRVPIYLLTGGFHEIVDNVAKDLNIPKENVFANRLLFDGRCRYIGIDENELTSKDNGKAEVIKTLKERFKYNNVVHIGDGMNDANVRPPATAFIGYGGVQVREKVKQIADWYVMDFQELIDELEK